MSFNLDFNTRGAGSAFDAAMAFHEARVQKAMLAATNRGGQRLKSRIREAMSAAGLGKLGQAIDATSDEQRAGIHHSSGGGISASGLVYVRSRSERTRGAIEAYTSGANIRPRKGRFLWIPSDDILRVAGGKGQKQRLSPGNWSALGMDSRVGRLEFIPNKGRPLLVVRGSSVNIAKRRSARALTKTGRARKGQLAVPVIVAFIGIPATSRAARIDVRALHAQVMAELPTLFTNELRRA